MRAANLAGVASYWTNKGKVDQASVAVPSADLRILLVDTPPASAAAAADLNFVADVVAVEIAATNYVRKTLTGEAVTEDDANDRAVIDADNPSTWTALGGALNDTIAGGWIFRQVTNDADSVLWCFLDLVPDLVTNGSDVILSFHATSGISTVT
jgi:hypothetical protein